MLIGFTLDTNILIGGNPQSCLLSNNLEIFKKYITVLKRKKSDKELKLLMSEIVIKEVLKHEEDKMKNAYDELKSKYDNIGFALIEDMPKEKIEHIIKDEKTRLKKLNIMKVPINEKVFSKLIDSAIEKRPPFVKMNEKKGDAGFKDALIWESILDSKDVGECDIFYFFTCDNDFLKDDSYLKGEFKKHHSNTKLVIELINSNGSSKKQLILNKLIEENGLLTTDIFDLYNEEYIIKFINDIKEEKTTIVDIEVSEDIVIDFENVKPKDIEVINVCDNKRELVVYINANAYTKTDPKKMISLNIDLYIEKENKDKLIKYKIYNVICISNVIERYTMRFEELSKALPPINVPSIFSINKLLNYSNFFEELNNKINVATNSSLKAVEMLNNIISNSEIKTNKDDKTE